MIIISKDPANISGSERFIQNTSLTWEENLFLIFNDGLDPRDWKLKFNGADLDIADLDLSSLPAADDILVMQHRPRGIELGTMAIIALIAGAAALAVTMLMPTASLTSSATGKTSSNNSFTGQTNLPRAYQAWPDLFGRNRIYPDIFSPSVVEYVNNVKTLRHYFWVGRGSHEITDVKYADSDVTSYANSAYNIYGDGVAIPEVIEQFANEAVNGQELLGTNESELSGISLTETVNSGTFVYSGRILTVNIPYSSSASLVYDDFANGNTTASTTFSTTVDTQTINYSTTGTITSFDINYDILGDPESYDITITVSAKPTYTTETVTGDIYIETHLDTLIGPYQLSVEAPYIWIDIVFLRGLKGTAAMKSEWWAVDENGDQISGTYQYENFSYSGNTLDQKYFTRKYTPTHGNGTYRFQIRRTNRADTENATNQAKLNALYAVRIKENQIYRVNGIGGTAIVVDSSATENATTSSGMKFNAIDVRKIITCNSDGSVNYTLSTSRRICDSVVHHMHIDKGIPLSKIDVAGLYAIQQAITPVELGYFDYSFDDADVSLGDRVKAMCNAGRILVNREGSKWTFIRDQAQAYPVATFDRRTTANEDFSLVISPTNNGGKDCVEIEWVDVEDSNTKKYVRLKWDTANNVPMFGFGYNSYKLTLDGCTSYAQALDRAELEMRKIVYQRKTVSDVALNDAEYVWRGDRVRWIDVADVSVGSGEILGVDDVGYVTSDECYFDETSVYKVCVTDELGYASSFVTATKRNDSINGFVAFGLPAVVLRNQEGTQLGSRYFLVKESEVDRHEFILKSKTPTGNGKYNIDLIQYDDRTYQRTLTA